MTTQRILDYIALRRPETPCLVLDLDVVRDNYRSLKEALPESSVFYAVKANPEPAILRLLSSMGSSFDAASVAEIEMALNAGATPSRISYGNTIKKERDIAKAYGLGVRLFAVDCIEEADKVARAAPGSAVFCRILTDGLGAEWPLSRKFGCTPEMAVPVLLHADAAGLEAVGVSFHVGSQQTDLSAWDRAIADAKAVFATVAERGVELRLLNMGGGFPSRYLNDVPATAAYGKAISEALAKHFGNRVPATIVEPGRGMVGNAGALRTEVVLVSKKSDSDDPRWVFLDVGKFGGLAETMDEAIRYKITAAGRSGPSEGFILAGPTCDSADVLYEKRPYPLPCDIEIGDEVLIEGTGAYTTTYSAVAFNGFAPLAAYVIPDSF